MMGFMAPAWTPLLWFEGIGLMARDPYFPRRVARANSASAGISMWAAWIVGVHRGLARRLVALRSNSADRVQVCGSVEDRVIREAPAMAIR
jgi:hypothetical protein